MKNKNHSTRAYSELGKVVEHARQWMVCHLPSLGCFEKDVVAERLSQIIVDTQRFSFYKSFANRINEKSNIIDDENKKVIIGIISVDGNGGRVAITWAGFLKQFLVFILVWGRMLSDILRSPFYRNYFSPVTIMLGGDEKSIIKSGCDEKFVEFCREGLITPLSQASKIIVEASAHDGSLSDPNIIYKKRPIFELIRGYPFSCKEWMKLLVKHLLCPIWFIFSVIKFPPIILLGRDVASLASIEALNASGVIESILITTTHYYEQPLWMRRKSNRNFKVHKVHYSQNDRPYVFKGDPIVADMPAFRYIKVDEHWVWTEDRKEYLKKMGHDGPVHVIGPIIWYLHNKTVNTETDEIRIGVFDVTPYGPNVAASHGTLSPWYTAEKMIKFVDEIFSACELLEKKLNKRFRILLKHKREYREGSHDQRYIDYIEKITREKKSFELIECREDLFELLDSCDFSISIPYTSVAYISSCLGKPTIYFDPSQELLPSYENLGPISFCSGKAELYDEVEKHFKNIVGKTL
jgi:hypothetical protein